MVPDNALTPRTVRSGELARSVTDRYQQMADHYGTAIVPTWVRKPRDKAAVESAVNTVNKRVIGYLAEEVGRPWPNLNDAIDERGMRSTTTSAAPTAIDLVPAVHRRGSTGAGRAAG